MWRRHGHLGWQGGRLTNPATSLAINFTDASPYTATFTDLADNFNPTGRITITGAGGVDTVIFTDLGDSFTGPLTQILFKRSDKR